MRIRSLSLPTIILRLAFALLGFSFALQAKPLNLILIYCDDLGYGDLGYTGHPIIKTPHIDSLAAEGVKFTHNYAGAPHCSPSRCVLLTGKASYRIGFYDIIGRGEMELPESEITLPERLREGGYTTYHGAKWHLNKSKEADVPLKHGFDYSNDPGMAINVVADFKQWDTESRDHEKPFFAYLAIHESHEPVEEWSPESYRLPYENLDEEKFATIEYGGEGVSRRRAELEKRAAYYGCVAQLDAAIGNLVAHLKETEQWENTFIYFSSDNGPEHRSDYSWGSPGSFRGAKGHLHEGGIRVPGFAVWPGRIEPESVSDIPIHAWDALPTFCRLAEVSTPKNIDGVDFLPATQGKKLNRDTPLYWSWYNARGGTNYIMREGDWKLLAIAAPRPKGRSIAAHIKSREIADYELYNLKKDPKESNDLSRSHPELVERLKAKFHPLHRSIVKDAPLIKMNKDDNS